MDSKYTGLIGEWVASRRDRRVEVYRRPDGKFGVALFRSSGKIRCFSGVGDTPEDAAKAAFLEYAAS